jgi:hypothetical protein
MDLSELKTRLDGVPGVADAQDEAILLEAVRVAYAAAEQDAADAKRELGQQIEELNARIAELGTRAELGDKYVADLIEQAVRGRVRVQGNDFDGDAYRAVLAKAGLDYVQSEIATWATAAKRLYVSGRQVPQGETPTVGATGAPQRPESPALHKV